MNHNIIKDLSCTGINFLYYFIRIDDWENIKSYGISRETNGGIGRIDQDEVYHNAEIIKGIDQYLHLSYSKSPAFLNVGLKKGTIPEDFFIVEIDLNKLTAGQFLFSDSNPYRFDSCLTPDFNSIKDKIEYARNPKQAYNISDKRNSQAEVLFKGVINVSAIRNFYDIDSQYSEKISRRVEIPRPLIITIEESIAMGRSVKIHEKEYDYASDAIDEMIKHFISFIVSDQSFYSENQQIAIIGYGDEISSFLCTPQGNSPMMSVSEIKEMYHKLDENQFIRNCKKASFNPDYTSVTKQVISLYEGLISKYGMVIPPIIINITEGSFILEDSTNFILNSTKILNYKSPYGKMDIYNNLITGKTGSETSPMIDKILKIIKQISTIEGEENESRDMINKDLIEITDCLNK